MKSNQFQRAIASFISNILSRHDDLDKCRTLFNKIDKNHDGKLDISELKTAMGSEINELFS